jgi:ketosteroid isomerase-like protein
MLRAYSLPTFVVALALPAPVLDCGAIAESAAVLEIRSYNLKSGTRERFHALFVHDALPLLQKARVDVVAYGPSLHDRDSYFLMRAFSGLEDRQRQEDAFYASDTWRTGPREAVLAAIDSYTTVVIPVDDATLRGLRGTMLPQQSPSDVELLVRLNNDYIESVKTSNVNRFRELLADDFLCTLPDGTLINREQFLTNTAKPYTLGSLQAHDVNVRLMGDFAIVHARTTFTQPDGAPGSGRYTDVWARRDGTWRAVAAHITRK